MYYDYNGPDVVFSILNKEYNKVLIYKLNLTLNNVIIIFIKFIR